MVGVVTGDDDDIEAWEKQTKLKRTKQRYYFQKEKERIKNEKEIVSEAPKGADAPKAGAGKADPMQKGGDYEDLGPALVKPDQKPGQDKADDKVKKDSSAPTKGAAPAEPMAKVKEDAHDGEDEKEKEDMKEAEHSKDDEKKKEDMTS